MAYPIVPQTGFHYLMMLYFLYQYATRLEREHYAGAPADMLYMMIVIFLTSSKLYN